MCNAHGVYKVETIGDCYMACTGLLVETDDHAHQLVEFGKAMLQAAATVRNPLGGSVQVRVGIHSGRVMSGIVGAIRARYCLFGEWHLNARLLCTCDRCKGPVHHHKWSVEPWCMEHAWMAFDLPLCELQLIWFLVQH